MNKFLMSAAIAVTAFSAAAEGYQVNTLSAKQIGMGHTGVALKLKSESMIFNPAGMAWMDETLDVSGSVSGIFPTAKVKTATGEYETDNEASTPLSFNLGFRVYDNLKVGISFYTPYGSNINWTNNWPGALLNQSVNLKVYTIQPTVAWKILPNFSIGAGLMVAWGNVDLNKGLVSPEAMDQVLAAKGSPYRFGETVPASVNLTGDAHPRFGVNVGAMWDINSQWTIGASYRSKVMMKVKSGTAKVSYANEIAEGALESSLGLINSANFSAEMPCAAIYTFGISYRPIERLILAFDAHLTEWNAYDQLEFKFTGNASAFNQTIEKNYKNSWTFHLGGEYKLTERFDVRAGLMVDTTPVDKNYYNPETPGMTKIEPSVGLSFRPFKGFSIDAAFLYVAGLGADNRSCTYYETNLITGEKEAKTFKGDYSLTAITPSIGVSYSF